MPPLHSLVFIDGPDVWLEALAPSPVIELNGRPTVASRIVDGDHIRIGSFELVAHMAPEHAAETAVFNGPVTPEQPLVPEQAPALEQSEFLPLPAA